MDRAKAPEKSEGAGFANYFLYDDFGLDYAESLTEGDLRPIVIKDYAEKPEENGK